MNIIGYHEYANGHVAVDSQNRFVAIVTDFPSKYIVERNRVTKRLIEPKRKVV